MALRLVTAVAAAALAALIAAGSASAHHEASVSATATSLTLEPSSCATYERRPRSRCDGYRRATVAWSTTCSADPDVGVEFFAARKDGGKPILLDSDAAPGLSGATSAVLGPGAHVFAVVTQYCTWANRDGTGPEEHTVTVRSAPSPQVTIPPWLSTVSVQKGNYCNFNPGSRTILQARQRGSIVSFSSDFVDRSLLGMGRRAPAAVRQRWVNAKGAGIRLRRRPEVFLLQDFGRREPFSGLLRPNPRRAGWLKLWEEVGGVRTNTLAIKVLPNRC